MEEEVDNSNLVKKLVRIVFHKRAIQKTQNGCGNKHFMLKHKA